MLILFDECVEQVRIATPEPASDLGFFGFHWSQQTEGGGDHTNGIYEAGREKDSSRESDSCRSRESSNTEGINRSIALSYTLTADGREPKANNQERPSMTINVLHLGLVPYETALQLQSTLQQLRKQGRIDNTLLLLEHPPVITMGRNAQLNNVLASPEFLAQKGVELFDIDRGGDVTFHGPGQLIAYPIFDLRSFEPKVGAVEFVRRLEEVLIRTCGDFGIGAQRIKGMTGVWTYALRNKPEAKVAGPTPPRRKTATARLTAIVAALPPRHPRQSCRSHQWCCAADNTSTMAPSPMDCRRLAVRQSA